MFLSYRNQSIDLLRNFNLLQSLMTENSGKFGNTFLWPPMKLVLVQEPYDIIFHEIGKELLTAQN